MPLRLRTPDRSGRAELRDPLEGQGWFRELPVERREELTAAWRAARARAEELARRERRRALVESAQLAVVFALGDLAAPGGGAASLLVALLLGACAGLALNRLDAGRLTSGAVGLTLFFALQWIGRGGLSGLHLLLFFPLGCVCAWLGWRREERLLD